MFSAVKRMKLALTMSRNCTEFFFHIGYQQIRLPTWFRTLIARSKCHRAWHSGFFGGGILSIEERYPWV
ncbi:MAG: hypothetical protein CL600_09870 [Alteromonas sp.]|nr:hypothetical protein [Alteromonas sp.]